MSATKTILIGDFIDNLSKRIEDLIGELANPSVKIIRGYDSYRFKSEKNTALRYVELLNDTVSDYAELLDIDFSISLVKDIKSLFSLTPEAIVTELKIRYLDGRDIKVPTVAFKKSKLAEAYDFPDDHSELIDSIVESVLEWREFNFAKKSDGSEYFNSSLNSFEFTKEQEELLLESHTRYASANDLDKIISLHLLCEGLSNLKEKDYSFKELPEIDHRITRLIKIDYAKDRVNERGVSVDIDKFNNLNNSSPLTQITQTNKPAGPQLKIIKRD